MKATTGVLRRRALCAFCVLALTWAMSSAKAVAQELVVVLSSAQDGMSADKLAELIREPFARVDAASLAALPPTAAGGCRTRARIELHLDSVERSVRLIRCRDATVLARDLDPEAARQTPYLGAFVAAELLAIDRELEAAEARASRSDAADAPAARRAPAAPSGRTTQPLAEASLVELQLRAGAELTLWGAPFDHSVRPSIGLAIVLAPDAAVCAWFAELSFGLFALAERQRAAESLALQRHDGALHAGVRFAVGPLYVAGFALLRASATRAEYRADLQTSDTYLRLGVGAGAQADVPLSGVLSVYLQLKLDVATSRSQYLVAGRSWATDPASLLWVGLGLSLRLGL